MNIITLDDLSKAIANRVGINIDEARRDAGFVMDIFGFQDRVIDNVLDPEDRQLFYLLQSTGILSNGRDETLLHDGREWRTHYWQLEREKICDLATQQSHIPKYTVALPHPKPRESQYDSVYFSLADDVWSTRKIDSKKPLY